MAPTPGGAGSTSTPLGRIPFSRADTSAGIIWQLLELAVGSPARIDVSVDLRAEACLRGDRFLGAPEPFQ